MISVWPVHCAQAEAMLTTVGGQVVDRPQCSHDGARGRRGQRRRPAVCHCIARPDRHRVCVHDMAMAVSDQPLPPRKETTRGLDGPKVQGGVRRCPS